ncbi:MAG: hypothetical protein GY861_13525 [bacterium]|nr:hypothetical protein [bacterium]
MIAYRIYDIKKDQVYDAFYEGYLTTPLFDVSTGEANNLMDGLEITYKRKDNYTDVAFYGSGYANLQSDLVEQEFLLTIEAFKDMGYEVENIGY